MESEPVQNSTTDIRRSMRTDAVSPTEADPPPLVPQPTSEVLVSNAVTRTLSDMHAPTWFALLALNITARTLVFHPMQLAVARKRVTREDASPSTWSLIKASYKGGDVRFYERRKTSATYSFGRGGVRGMYRGVGAALMSNLGGEISYLFTLELLREKLSSRGVGQRGSSSSPTCDTSSGERGHPRENDGNASCEGQDDEFSFHVSSTSAAIGAMCGDVVALGLVTPVVIVASRQMTAGYGMASHTRYERAWPTFKEVWCTYQGPTSTSHSASSLSRWVKGGRGIYQGASAGLLRVPSSGCWWALYTKNKELLYTEAAPRLSRWEDEAVEARLRAAEEGHTLPRRSFWQQNWFLSPTDNPLLNAVAGISASVCTTVLFNPIAVIQTRQQAIPKTAASADVVRTWRLRNPFGDVVKVSKDLVKREGVRAFFKGTSANVSVAILDGIIFSLLFELTKLGSDHQFLEHVKSD